MKKKDIWLWVSIFILAAFLVMQGRKGNLIGISVPYTFMFNNNGQNYTITTYTSSDYYVQEGCLGYTGVNACKVIVEPLPTSNVCQEWNVYAQGYYNCDAGYGDICAYGNNCNEGTSPCKYHCSWSDKRFVGVRGGIDYKSKDGCSWYIEIKDMNGILIKKWSQDLLVAGWNPSRPYMEDAINSTEWGLYFPYEINKGINCNYVKGTLKEGNWVYDYCIGDNWEVGDTRHCTVPLTKRCGLTSCGVGYNLDNTTCSCLKQECILGETEPDCNSKIDKIELLNNLQKWLKGETDTLTLINIVKSYILFSNIDTTGGITGGIK